MVASALSRAFSYSPGCCGRAAVSAAAAGWWLGGRLLGFAHLLFHQLCEVHDVAGHAAAPVELFGPALSLRLRALILGVEPGRRGRALLVALRLPCASHAGRQPCAKSWTPLAVDAPEPSVWPPRWGSQSQPTLKYFMLSVSTVFSSRRCCGSTRRVRESAELNARGVSGVQQPTLAAASQPRIGALGRMFLRISQMRWPLSPWRSWKRSLSGMPGSLETICTGSADVPSAPALL